MYGVVFWFVFVGMDYGNKVSVYADVEGKCRKGLTKPFQQPKLFVGNGVAEMSRSELFCSEEKAR